MRVVFLGTPRFAVPAFQKLIETSYEICGVFTQPERPVGRGQNLQPSPIKVAALAHEIPVYQPEKIRAEENRRIFEELRPDFVVVVAFGQILPGWLLQAARFAPINIHASLLPRYRGAAPIAWAIMNGETITGVTTMIMREKVDSGPVLMQHEHPISLTRTAGELSDDLAEIGASLLIRTLDAWQQNAVKPLEQDESKVSWAPRITKAIARISWEKPALQIHNQIRGLNPWPAAYSIFRGDRLLVWRSLPETGSSGSQEAPGTLLGFSKDAMRVQCGEGTILNIMEVQVPSKSRISGRQFTSGARLHVGDRIL